MHSSFSTTRGTTERRLGAVLGMVMVLTLVSCATSRPEPTAITEANAFLGAELPTEDHLSAEGAAESPGVLTVRGGCAAIAARDMSDAGKQPALIAPLGSKVASNGHSIFLKGIGTYSFGQALPRVLVVRRTLTREQLTGTLRACGATEFIEVFPTAG